MASRVIDVALKLRDAFTGPMKGAISSLTSFDKEGTRVRKSVEKVGKGIAGVGTAMTAAVTVPLAGLATASAAKFGEVDKSLKLVQQTMGSTDEQAKVLEGAIKKAAANSVYGMQDAADAALNYARQGHAGSGYDRSGNESCSGNRDGSGNGYGRRRKCDEDLCGSGAGS